MEKSKKVLSSAKECAYIAVFVALLIAAQLIFSAIPGVELVTLLFVSYAFTFGVVRGVISATVFSLLRQILFGFYPTVLVLYLLYYNFLVVFFGTLSKYIKQPKKYLWLLVLIACLCTISFTMMDNILTSLWYGYSEKAREVYFKASLPFMIPQVICTAGTVACLFLPLTKIFYLLKK